eukprot:CAMPEP_0180222738 /NCGR_PEP_ID=MMETSP0987-20121128/20934_1 /TAXON_ID=697907 /ORGANISM="non described non described, Strain CCMP2293" /LENGTH=351 /DNA_ID=CAMNT_0022184973 /DNA_START=74 /DNA_END=1126 /DNA_ORIENTATION=-
MSLAFLCKKSWHTSNFSVQKRVFEVEEAEKKRKKTDSERAKTLEQERMFEESSRMASERQHSNAWEDPKAQVRKKGGALGFMYEAPPGYIPDDETPAPKRIVAEKEDDDDAESVAAGAAQGGGGAGGQGGPDPRSIQPLGIQVRNVFCAKCKEFGHQMGDDECKMKAMTVEQEKFRQQIEDPLMLYDGSSGAAVTERLVLRQAIDGVHGGRRTGGAVVDEQEILLSDEDEPPRVKPVQKLSKEHRKAAKSRLKELKKELKSTKKESKGEKKAEKKASKDEKRRNRTPSSSPSPARVKQEDRPRQGAATFWAGQGGGGGKGGGDSRGGVEVKREPGLTPAPERSGERGRGRS